MSLNHTRINKMGGGELVVLVFFKNLSCFLLGSMWNTLSLRCFPTVTKPQET